jgi:hypothetical protein
MTTPDNDPVIDEIRQIRHDISEQFRHDPAKLVEYYMQFQERFRDRLLRPDVPRESADPSAN